MSGYTASPHPMAQAQAYKQHPEAWHAKQGPHGNTQACPQPLGAGVYVCLT